MNKREPKLVVIIDNLLDIMVVGGKLIISYIKDGWDSISHFWHNEIDEEEREMWNGGKTFFDEDEKTPTPYDEGFGENNLIDNNGNVIYDGVYDDVNG
tara:strand:+ start:532 stop:825 length:294 start_codon:yes stop_codon:yes gene_type:complete